MLVWDARSADLHGSTLVQTIQDMEAGGESVTLNTLRESLEEREFIFRVVANIRA